MGGIAIFGGTFNPPHIGHFEMLKALDNADFIEKILVVPTKIPPHKAADMLASENDRINMCALLCEGIKKAEVSLIDINREGKSYSIYTVREIRKQNPDKKLYFAIGGDMLSTLDTWYLAKKLICETDFIVFSRGNNKAFSDNLKRLEKFGANIYIFDDLITDISSTALRATLKKEYLKDNIYDYIIKRNLYNGKIL